MRTFGHFLLNFVFIFGATLAVAQEDTTLLVPTPIIDTNEASTDFIEVKTLTPSQISTTDKLTQQFWNDFKMSGGEGELIEITITEAGKESISDLEQTLLKGYMIRVSKVPDRINLNGSSIFNRDQSILDGLKEMEKKGIPIVAIPPRVKGLNGIVLAPRNVSHPRSIKKITNIVEKINPKGLETGIFGLTPSTTFTTFVHESQHIYQGETGSTMNRLRNDLLNLTSDPEIVGEVSRFSREWDAYYEEAKVVSELDDNRNLYKVKIEDDFSSYKLLPFIAKDFKLDRQERMKTALRSHAKWLDRFIKSNESERPKLFCEVQDAVLSNYKNTGFDMNATFPKSAKKCP